jgi:AraC-like DNA-binding protein
MPAFELINDIGIDVLEKIENHRYAAAHHAEASKYHAEAAKHHEVGNHTEAALSTILAHGHTSLAHKAQSKSEYMKLFIQNMVSLRCKLLVKSELEKLDIDYDKVELGEVTLYEDISNQKLELLKMALHQSGLELMDDKKSKLIEKIKNVVVEMVHYSDELPKVNFSEYLSEKLGMDYYHLSDVFSKTKGMTIEHFIILHKIERVKELIIYDELNLTEIAWKLHYSSVAHLSNQFKKITGLTPSFFKSLKFHRRKTLESI